MKTGIDHTHYDNPLHVEPYYKLDGYDIEFKIKCRNMWTSPVLIQTVILKAHSGNLSLSNFGHIYVIYKI